MVAAAALFRTSAASAVASGRYGMTTSASTMTPTRKAAAAEAITMRRRMCLGLALNEVCHGVIASRWEAEPVLETASEFRNDSGLALAYSPAPGQFRFADGVSRIDRCELTSDAT